MFRKLRAPLVALTATIACTTVIASGDRSRLIPAPAVDEQAAPHGKQTENETIVLAGGCFWGVQGVFQHLKGVTNAVSGYAGGDEDSAHYERVSNGGTGHAESVSVTFDPKQVSLGRILQVYFSVAHDPTQLNRQGPDTGTQYRSAIFPTTPEQATMVRAYISQLNDAHVFPAGIVTRVESGKKFFPAEAYHQNYLALNPMSPYIVINDLPKVASLKQLFPELYRTEPVLVANAR